MVNYQWIFFTLLFSFSLTLSGQGDKKYYQDQLEADAKLVKYGYNFTVEALPSGKHIRKQYFPDTKVMTHSISYTNKKLKVKDGPYAEWYDDGTLILRGNYVNNEKDGGWIERDWKGSYAKGEKNGTWIRYDKKDRKLKEMHYQFGKLQGPQITYDTLGNVTAESVFELGKLVSTTADTTTVTERLPRYKGCEEVPEANGARKKCADRKLLEYIYGSVRYPGKARDNGVQGTAIVHFVIEKDGSIQEVEVLRGLSKEIAKECQGLVERMPAWLPGMQNGAPVRVQFTLPITFKLR
ncbi:MAG: TonB family protein [Bacteroidota bacterium]